MVGIRTLAEDRVGVTPTMKTRSAKGKAIASLDACEEEPGSSDDVMDTQPQQSLIDLAQIASRQDHLPLLRPDQGSEVASQQDRLSPVNSDEETFRAEDCIRRIRANNHERDRRNTLQCGSLSLSRSTSSTGNTIIVQDGFHLVEIPDPTQQLSLDESAVAVTLMHMPYYQYCEDNETIDVSLSSFELANAPPYEPMRAPPDVVALSRERTARAQRWVETRDSEDARHWTPPSVLQAPDCGGGETGPALREYDAALTFCSLQMEDAARGRREELACRHKAFTEVLVRDGLETDGPRKFPTLNASGPRLQDDLIEKYASNKDHLSALRMG